MKVIRYIDRIAAKIENIGILSIGDGDDELRIDKDTMSPIIPATGIAGAFRAYLKECGIEREKLDDLFGSDNHQKSKIFIQDGIGTKTIYEKRTRTAIDRRTGAAEDKKIYTTKYLTNGSSFDLQIVIEALEETELEFYYQKVMECIKALDKKLIRFGGQKTNGAGEFKVNEINHFRVDCFDKRAYADYLLGNYKYINSTNELEKIQLKYPFIIVRVKLHTDTPILISGIRENGRDKENIHSIKNGKGDYIIPGSSLKGVLRAQCEKISEFLMGEDKSGKNLFGTQEDELKRGNVFISDVLINRKNDTVVYHGIAVDRFTGGVKKGEKFDIRPVCGECEFEIFIDKKHVEDKDVGILFFALRDMIHGMVSIGGKTHMGFGYMSGAMLDIIDEGKKYENICFDDEKGTPLEKYIQAVQNGKGKIDDKDDDKR